MKNRGPFLPNGNLINKGELIHKYDNGTSFTITKDGSAQIGRIKTSISATAHETQHTVGVYGINRKVGAQGIYLYTDRWGKEPGNKIRDKYNGGQGWQSHKEGFRRRC